MKLPTIVTIDIETAPINGHVWGIWEQNLGLDMIGDDWTILSYAYKYLDNSKTFYADAGGRGIDQVRNDAELMRGLWEVLNAADIVVGHNVKKFDLKKINARMFEAGLPPYSPVRVIDTLSSAKTHFAFTSNKLEHLADKTGTPKLKHKKFPGFELWKECLADNPKAWAEMKRYNVRDVVATEKLYVMMRPWIANHPNLGAYSETTDEHECPKCGSTNTHREGVRVLQQGRYHRYQCGDCGGWSRGKELVIPLAKRRKMLVPS